MRLYGILRAVNRNVTNHGLSVGKLMALRLVTQKPPTFFMESQKDFDELLTNCDDMACDKKFNQPTQGKLEGYHAILNLACTSINATQLEIKTRFAIALLWLLERSNYFTQLEQAKFPDDSNTQLKSFILKLIVRVRTIISYCSSCFHETFMI